MLNVVCNVCDGDAFLSDSVKCDPCNSTGWTGVPDNQIVYVNAYRVTREFGGHEEGGWWYDNYECIEVFPVKNKAADVMADALLEEHSHIVHGDISSVLGGAELRVLIEEKPKESETRERPHYE